MKNKGVIVALTIIITLLCIYYLSFTIVSRNIQRDAVVYATDAETGMVSDYKKQDYLDSMWNLPVYNLFGIDYTFKEIKDTELNLGLDLQGGMHVVLEISPVDVIKGLSGNNEDPIFIEALKRAGQLQKESQDSYTDLFFRAYSELNPGKPIAPIFATAANRGRISSSDDDEVVMEVIRKEVVDAIDRSEIILRTRIDQFGTSQPNIQRLPGTGRIQIEIPGAENPERVRKLLQGVAKLEFWEVAEPYEIEALNAINQLLVRTETTRNNAGGNGEVVEEKETLQDLLGSESGTSDTSALASASDNQDSLKAKADSAANLLDSLTSQNISPLLSLSNPPGAFVYDLRDTSTIGRIFRREDVLSLLPRNIKFFWSSKATVINDQELISLNFVRAGRGGAALMEGDVVTDARPDFDQYGKPVVSMTMNAAGTKRWAAITREAASRSPKGRIAIVLDDYVFSAPSVNEEIPNGNSQISGAFNQDEVRDLANILKAGSLPAPTRIVEEAIVGPTLGKIAREQGIISIFSGFAIVVLFMIAYYSKGGIIANVALLFNVFFILGILANYNAALTLPGIAGIVLTIGMSVDANVLIFERIREELRRGVKLREAVNTGYGKAFWTIFDSNLTTLIAAVVLIIFGQGPVKGFAVTLMIGIFCSFFSAVYITRVIVEAVMRKGDESKISFQSVFSQGILSSMNINFMSVR
ncbi:MAG: protein translocase subunit SecD, partial [Cyclobacteriaceae bacterium]|nr:protein translocase subunit SecD [Cyclobacteriaceae bacterium]